MRHLHFGGVRGDLQEGNGCASRCQLPLFLVPIPIFLSTKSRFLCFLGIWSPHFRAFRAQNRGFCAFLAFETLVFGLFEHKIGIFVRFWGLEPSFSGFLSTESGFLCSRGGESGIGKRNREDAYHFATAPTPSHQRTDTSAPAQQRPPAMAPGAVKCCLAFKCHLAPCDAF